MLIHDEEITIIKVEQKSGTSKAGKPYSFYSVEFADSSLNKFQSIVPRKNLSEGVVPQWLLEADKLECSATIEIVPDGRFGLRMNLIEIFEK